MNDAIVGVLVGSGVSLVGALLLDQVRFRREQRRRWDRDRLEAVISLVAAAQEFEGAQYLRGRIMQEPASSDESVRQQREETARAAYQQLLLAGARARMLLAGARAEIDAISAAAKKLRDLADVGFASRRPEWVAARDAHRASLEALTRSASGHVGLDLPGGNGSSSAP